MIDHLIENNFLHIDIDKDEAINAHFTWKNKQSDKHKVKKASSEQRRQLNPKNGQAYPSDAITTIINNLIVNIYPNMAKDQKTGSSVFFLKMKNVIWTKRTRKAYLSQSRRDAKDLS